MLVSRCLLSCLTELRPWDWFLKRTQAPKQVRYRVGKHGTLGHGIPLLSLLSCSKQRSTGIAQIFRENMALSLHWKRRCMVVKIAGDSSSVLLCFVFLGWQPIREWFLHNKLGWNWLLSFSSSSRDGKSQFTALVQLRWWRKWRRSCSWCIWLAGVG